MTDSWALFTEEVDDFLPAPSVTNPSSYNDDYDTISPVLPSPPINIPRTPTPNISPMMDPMIGNKHDNRMLNSSGSAPSQLPIFNVPEKETRISESVLYASIGFRTTRNEILKYRSSLNIKPSDYVMIEADRGIDIGFVQSIVSNPSPKDMKNARSIIRKASEHEINLLPSQREKEKRATEICREKAADLGLDMTITDTEFQFDGKKLTVYFSASQYIDFRALIRVLFKIFETRIWMVWYDGNAPVKDVMDPKKGFPRL